jgi:hypothetical protein
VLGIAGLWDRRHSAETGETVFSCTMIVTDPNAFTRAVHNRIPVLLNRPDLAMAERRSRTGGAAAGGRRSPAHVAGVAADEPDRRR